MPPAIVSPPEGFCCPLSGELLTDPVVATDGYSYERNCIQAYFQQQVGPPYRSPSTGQVLASNFLISNVALRRAIDSWLQSRCISRREGGPWDDWNSKHAQGGDAGSAAGSSRPGSTNASSRPPSGGASGAGARGPSGGGGSGKVLRLPFRNFFSPGGASGSESLLPGRSGSAEEPENGLFQDTYVVGIPGVPEAAPVGRQMIHQGQVLTNQKPWRWAWDPQKSHPSLTFECNNWIARRPARLSSGSSPKPLSELVAIASRPIRVRYGEVMEFHLKLLESSTAWGGLHIGVVPESPPNFLLTAENLYGAIDDRGYYVDGERWYRTPGSVGNTLTPFNSAALKANDVVSLVVGESGVLFVFVNGALVVRLGESRIEMSSGISGMVYNAAGAQSPYANGSVGGPSSSSSSQHGGGTLPGTGGTNLYPFVVLAGSCEVCEIGVERPSNLVLPEECAPPSGSAAPPAFVSAADISLTMYDGGGHQPADLMGCNHASAIAVPGAAPHQRGGSSSNGLNPRNDLAVRERTPVTSRTIVEGVTFDPMTGGPRK
ncbi:unnamed protein product [Amoebophrya sp. A25]|nr:unnamed protein product [Amoebophrya sp. A25]|eukprot:GSA25T00000804001.1